MRRRVRYRAEHGNRRSDRDRDRDRLDHIATIDADGLMPPLIMREGGEESWTSGVYA